MTAELFDTPESLSPRLAWMRKHKLETMRNPSPKAEDGESPWVCRVIKTAESKSGLWWPNEIAGGDTEEQACEQFAMNRGLKHWNQQTL